MSDITVPFGSDGSPSKNIEAYFELKNEMYKKFYDLKTTERFRVLTNESKYALLVCGGYFFAVFQYYVAKSFDMAAHAQDLVGRGLLGGMTKSDAQLIIVLTTHAALLFILILCFVQVLFSKRKHHFAKGIVTFLLGFFTKTLIEFFPPFSPALWMVG